MKMSLLLATVALLLVPVRIRAQPDSLMVLGVAASDGPGGAAVAAVGAPDDSSEPCPFAGHNTYGGDDQDKLQTALDAGLDTVEVDETYGRLRHRPVVTHNSLSLGIVSPELGAYLEAVWSRWKDVRGGNHVLVLDTKTDSEDLARRE